MKDKLKFLCVVGARPNFMKIAPLLEEFKKYNRIKPILVHTGQHYDYEMSPVFLQDLNIQKADYNLGVGSGFHGKQTGKIMIEFEKVCLKEKPDLVIVVGDVNSTLAAALVAAKLHISVAHIEAGTRSYDKTIPEEINRVLTDHISDFLFCPTKSALKNLKNEAIVKGVHFVGDVMYDALIQNLPKAQKKSRILLRLNLNPKDYILATIHRPKNVDNIEKLKSILEALSKISKKYLPVIIPLHPRTKKQLEENPLFFPFLRLIDPVSYLDMLVLENNAKVILTDSGGVQRESFFLKVPCITLREKTEWVETVKDGWNILVGSNKEKIIQAVKYFRPGKRRNKHFGDGKATEKIVKILVDSFQYEK